MILLSSGYGDEAYYVSLQSWNVVLLNEPPPGSLWHEPFQFDLANPCSLIVCDVGSWGRQNDPFWIQSVSVLPSAPMESPQDGPSLTFQHCSIAT